MSDDQRVFTPSHPLPAARTGVLTAFAPGTRTLEAGFRIAPQFRALPVDVVLDKDVAVRLRDGVTIHLDVFRPAGAEQVPVIVAWSPYGKGQGSSPSVMGVFGLVGLDNAIVSGLEKFEGPDPAYWCARGYAIANPDVRGVVDSEGDSVLWDRQEGRDCHDVIEWLAQQPWCSGRVGMSGTSYLAVAQWFTAAEQPPHLAAINPWEGVSDVYRDLVMRGGMPDTGFARQLQEGSFFGRNRKEDILAEVERHPLVTDLWENKVPDFGRITVPAYVVASYSNTLHTAGTFRAWRRIASPEKWLRIHNSQEWPDYYDEGNVEDLRRFFDHYLRGEDNGWERTPRVRYSVLDLQGGDRVGVPADRFPPAGATSTRYHLDGRSRALTTTAPTDEAAVSYAVDANPDAVSFLLSFDRDTELVGYPKAHLWVEARDADDMICSCSCRNSTPTAHRCRRSPCPTRARSPTTSPTTARASCGTRARTDGCASRPATSTTHSRPTTYRPTPSTASTRSRPVRSSRSRSSCSRSGSPSTPGSSCASSSAPATSWER